MGHYGISVAASRTVNRRSYTVFEVLLDPRAIAVSLQSGRMCMTLSWAGQNWDARVASLAVAVGVVGALADGFASWTSYARLPDLRPCS